MTDINPELEIWKPVLGSEDLYQVSNLGRVRSLSRRIAYIMADGHEIIRIRKERILKISFDKQGYARVGSVAGPVYVHHLVLEAFGGRRPDGLIGLHFDDNPTNCVEPNLRWGTRQQNADDAKRNGRKIGAPFGNKNRLGGVKA